MTGEMSELETIARMLSWYYSEPYQNWHTMPRKEKRMWLARAEEIMEVTK